MSTTTPKKADKIFSLLIQFVDDHPMEPAAQRLRDLIADKQCTIGKLSNILDEYQGAIPELTKLL